jgi:diacylglycerol kinase family enzyme
MRIKVIQNPASHHGRTAAYADPIRALGDAHGGLEMVRTEGPGHAIELAAEAAEQGYDVVAAAGGDGTVHEVVNGLAAVAGARPVLGVVPIGSGNDFAFALGLSSPLAVTVGRLFGGQPRPFDAAVIEDNHGRRVVVDNSVGIGFDASVTIQSGPYPGSTAFRCTRWRRCRR